MPRSEPSDSLSKFRSGSGITKTTERPQQFACDRCRGQKLRCIRSPDLDAPCKRCQKAGATCVVDSSIRMGRPKRTDKEQGETTNSTRKPSQSTISPTSPTTFQLCSHSATKGVSTNSDIWLGQDLDDTIDSSLLIAQYQDSVDFGLHHATLEDDSMDISPSEDSFGHVLDFGSPSISQKDAVINMSAVGNLSMEHVPEVNFHSYSPLIQQESVQKVSNLNLELYRQLSIIGPMAAEFRSVDPSLVESLDKNKSLSGASVFMIQSLQTFHDLVLGIQSLCEETTTYGDVYGSHESQQHVVLQNTKPYSTTLLSLADGRDDTLGQFVSEPSSWKEAIGPRSESSSEPHVPDNPPHITFLDMPTSLLIISCYMNLIHLCRDVFAAIRAALPAPGQHKTGPLLTLSGFQFSGISIYQDSDLQVIVLTQAVVRLVDRIGHTLGHPYNYSAKAGKRDEAEAHRKVIPPQLLDFVLRQGGTERQPSYKVGIEALREEIRRLNELVYKPV